jgi:hypothetical protein
MLRFQIANERERKQLDHVSGPIEIGRGPERAGVARCIIRDLYVSKDQARLEKLPTGLVRIQNLSTKQPLNFSSSSPIPPGGQRDCTLPLRFTVGETTIDVEDAAFDVIQRDLLASIAQPLRARRAATVPAHLKQLGETPTPATLIQWFETVIAVQKSAAGSPEFYQQTAQALIDLVGLDRGLVLLRDDNAWTVAARAASAASVFESPSRDFSQTILRYVLAEKRTFYQATLSGAVAESLVGVDAVVASPIFDAEAEIIGVLYGSRGRCSRELPTIGPLEAQVVQLLASTLGVGLARLHQEMETARMRVAKEAAEEAHAKEVEYLRNVAIVTDAAAAVETGRFDCPGLNEVAQRTDALGQLARMFEKMVKEVQEREAKLKEQVQQLRIEIDQSRRERQVAEITETDYFYQLQQKAANLRQRRLPPQ